MKNEHRIWPDIQAGLSRNYQDWACKTFRVQRTYINRDYIQTIKVYGEESSVSIFPDPTANVVYLLSKKSARVIICLHFPCNDVSEARKGDTRRKRTYGILGSSKHGISSGSKSPASMAFVLSSSCPFQILTNSRRSNHEQELHFCLKTVVSYSSSPILESSLHPSRHHRNQQ